MLHFVTSCMKRNKSRKQTLESAQYGLEISFKGFQQNRKRSHVTWMLGMNYHHDLSESLRSMDSFLQLLFHYWKNSSETNRQ